MARACAIQDLRRHLAALDRRELEMSSYLDAAIDAVSGAVAFDATCWATVDPDTLVLTSQTTVAFQPSPELEARFVEIEYGGHDPHSFVELAERGIGAIRLSDAGPSRVARSERLADVYGPIGVRHELRTAFLVDQRCWGVAGLLRGPGSDFTDDEVAALAAASPLIARGLRAAAARSSAQATARLAGPAVVVIGADGAVRSATPAALEHLATLGMTDGRLAFALRALVASLAAGHGEARSRVRDADGRWTTLRAAPLATGTAGSHDIAVTVDPASGVDASELRLAAFGLTPRELELCRHVLAGRSTRDIAAALHLSPHTVQDHLKSIFAKVGVSSRRALAAACLG